MKNRSLTELVITGAASIGIVYAFVYVSLYQPLASQQYNDHGKLSSAISDVSDLKSAISDIQTRVDWLSEQKGYNEMSMGDTTKQ